MDLRLFAELIMRSKRLVAAGIVAGLLLAILAYARPSLSGGPALVPRTADVWQSTAQLLITQASDPYGRADQADGQVSSLATLAPVYAAMATGEQANELRRSRTDIVGQVNASAPVDEATGVGLPFVSLSATSSTAADAEALVHVSTGVLEELVAGEQQSANVPTNQRITLVALTTGGTATLIQKPKLSVPILVFFAVVAGVLVLIFVRENLKPSNVSLPKANHRREHAGDATLADIRQAGQQTELGALPRQRPSSSPSSHSRRDLPPDGDHAGPEPGVNAGAVRPRAARRHTE